MYATLIKDIFSRMHVTCIRHILAVNFEAKVNPNLRELLWPSMTPLGPLTMRWTGFVLKFGFGGVAAAAMTKTGNF